jgi:uncharacterized protein (DUF2132 family)
MLTELVERYGWDSLGNQVNIRCFQFEPSIKSSLKFLRRTLGPGRGRGPVPAPAR